MDVSNMNAFRLDKSVVRIRALDDPRRDLRYWLSQPPAKRIQAIEFLRETFHGHGYPAQGLERVLRIVEQA